MVCLIIWEILLMIIDRIAFQQGIACFYSSFVNVAKYINNTFCEETAFLKCKGMKFETNIDKISSLSEVSLSNRLNEMVSEILDAFSINSRYIVFDKYIDLYNFIIENLDNKKPVIIKVDSKMLKHSPVYYENKSRNHTLIIFGYDLQNQSFSFFDSFIPTFPAESTKGVISFSELEKTCIYNRAFYFDHDLFKNIDFSFKSGEFRLCIEDNINSYFTSLNRLMLVADYLNNLLAIFSEEDIKTHLSEISYNITFNGIIPSRYIMRDICEKSDLKDFYFEWQCIINEWYSLSLVLVKYSFAVNPAKLKKASDKMISIIETEKVLMRKIYKGIH